MTHRSPHPISLLARRGVLATAAVISLALVAGCSPQAEEVSFNGVDITGANYGKTLAMTDVNGQPRTLDDFKGKAVVLFFGYAQCPDVCPTTLAEVAQARQMLGEQGARVQPVFVTVDPERDTAEILKAYVANFGADNVALRGSLDETQAAAREFKVFYEKVPGTVPGSYTVNHTAGSYLIDPKGNLRVFEKYGSGVDALVADLKVLINGG